MGGKGAAPILKNLKLEQHNGQSALEPRRGQ